MAKFGGNRSKQKLAQCCSCISIFRVGLCDSQCPLVRRLIRQPLITGGQPLTARNQRLADETPDQRALRIAKADSEYRDAAATLSQLLLGPVASELGHKRLVIIGAS